MCIRDSYWVSDLVEVSKSDGTYYYITLENADTQLVLKSSGCLLYTSDAADERSSVDLGGRRIIKKKNTASINVCVNQNINYQHHASTK